MLSRRYVERFVSLSPIGTSDINFTLINMAYGGRGFKKHNTSPTHQSLTDPFDWR